MIRSRTNIKKQIKKKIELNMVSKSERNKLRKPNYEYKLVNVQLLSKPERNEFRNVGVKKTESILVKNNNDTFQLLIDKLVENKPFSFLRFGDADYLMMDVKNIGKIIGSSNRMLITPEFNEEIIESHQIVDDNYVIGTILYPDNANILYNYNSFLSSRYKKILKYNINYTNLVSAVALTETYVNDIYKFSRLIHLLKLTKTMFVGSYYHKNLNNMYGDIIVKINTPKQNSYSDIDRIYNEIVKDINNVDKIIFSCGQTARIIIKRLWKAGYKKILLDVGSLSDYFILNTKLGSNIQLRGHIVKNSELIINNFEILKQII